MRNRPFALFALLPLCAVACAAESPLLRFAPPGSRVLVGINLRQVKASAIGQAIVSEASAKMEAGASDKFIAATGIDPRDIDEVLIASPERSRTVFLMRGSFDPTRFAEMAAGPDMTASMFQGVQILAPARQQQQPMAFACLSNTLIAGGDPAMLRSVIAARDSGPGPGAALEARAAELAAAHDIWFVSITPPVGLAGGIASGKAADNPQMQMLRSIEQASGGVRLGPTLDVAADLTTRTPEDAQNIAAALQLLIGLAAQGNRNSKQAAAILEKLALRAERNTVKLAFSIPEDELKKSVQAAVESARRRAQAATAPRAATPAPAAPAGVTIYSSPKDMGVVTLPPPK
ncbi:MAG: hypothetical protein ACM336_13875 [Acidobacteriota bacterium]